MRGGQSPCQRNVIFCSGLRQFTASQKSKRLARAYKTGGKKQTLSGDHSGFSSRSLLLFLFIVLTMKTEQLMRKRYRRCAQDCSVIEPYTVQDCDKKSSEMTILRIKVYFYTGEEMPVTYN
ncbi:hypothetical protein HVW75_01925 [Klebsiella pneumoniae]|uniref:hypothetical protein n=1 Tax=Klebsiella pneumoniae TaxID=573 RepID=UPI0015F68DB9|nr:hypothetical protein [Klebsiella pneumoniae]